MVAIGMLCGVIALFFGTLFGQTELVIVGAACIITASIYSLSARLNSRLDTIERKLEAIRKG